jgi:hypothetical protein
VYSQASGWSELWVAGWNPVFRVVVGGWGQAGEQVCKPITSKWTGEVLVSGSSEAVFQGLVCCA